MGGEDDETGWPGPKIWNAAKRVLKDGGKKHAAAKKALKKSVKKVAKSAVKKAAAKKAASKKAPKHRRTRA